MVTSVFFNNFRSFPEQKLIEDLIVESIRVYGTDVYYLPRTVFKADEVLNENQYVAFRDALQLEMYVKSVDGFEGDGQLLGKFGLEVRDQITLIVSRRGFDRDVLPYANIQRPREGDLIFIPFLDAAYMIKFAEQNPTMFQMGTLQTWELVCELYEYSNEIFNTGVPEIDQRFAELYISMDDTDNVLMTENGVILATEGFDSLILDSEEEYNEFYAYGDNKEINIESSKVLDFTELSPFGD